MKNLGINKVMVMTAMSVFSMSAFSLSAKANVKQSSIKVDQCISKNNVQVPCENQPLLDETVLKLVQTGDQTLVIAYLPCCVGSLDQSCEKPCR